jgi:hypothetical protein
MNQLNILTSLAVATTLAASSVLAHEGEKQESASATDEVTVTGEVVDMVCYIDEGASGAEHADCAQTCIKMVCRRHQDEQRQDILPVASTSP